MVHLLSQTDQIGDLRFKSSTPEDPLVQAAWCLAPRLTLIKRKPTSLDFSGSLTIADLLGCAVFLTVHYGESGAFLVALMVFPPDKVASYTPNYSSCSHKRKSSLPFSRLFSSLPSGPCQLPFFTYFFFWMLPGNWVSVGWAVWWDGPFWPFFSAVLLALHRAYPVRCFTLLNPCISFQLLRADVTFRCISLETALFFATAVNSVGGCTF